MNGLPGGSDLQVRSIVVYQWLHALKALNPQYKDINIDETPEMTTALANIKHHRSIDIFYDPTFIKIDEIADSECVETKLPSETISTEENFTTDDTNDGIVDLKD